MKSRNRTAKIRNPYAERTGWIFICYFLTKYRWIALMRDDSAFPAGDFAPGGAVSKYRIRARTMAFSICARSCLAAAEGRS